MGSTFTIPLTTLPVGTLNFGPSNIPDADSSIVLTIDRTVTNGLNSLTATTTLFCGVDQSNDGGVTWQNVAEATTIGGVLVDRHGVTATTFGFTVFLQAGTSRKLRARTIVGGTSVAVAGTIVTS